ncbi:MAG: hypothetical protein M0Z32_07750 [Actinomycetota bacterium]|nr:hypothetical protein [Actinomycetota bacterium]MCL6093967.1 hypothetical protein [Actinomycetota bacterium]MDA8167619.1 hypothetical protein [Actinomycetota bacterium]
MHFELQQLNRLTFPHLPKCCGNCGWWQGHDDGWSTAEADHWNQVAEERFGRWGKLAFGDGRLLGMVQFAPSPLFARKLRAGPAGVDSVLLTCSLVAEPSLDSVRKSLVLAVLSELHEDGIDTVEAFCRLLPRQQDKGHFFEQDFLRECGFNPVRSSRGVQLMRLELGGVQPVYLPARRKRRGILRRLKRPAPVPVAFAAEEPAEAFPVPACF